MPIVLSSMSATWLTFGKLPLARSRRDRGPGSQIGRDRRRRTRRLVEQHVSRAVDRRGQVSGFASLGLDPPEDALVRFADGLR